MWKEKANAAAESARLLQAVVALMRRWRGETPLPDPPTEGVEIRGKNKDKKDKKAEPHEQEEEKVEEVDEETKELRRRLEKEARFRRELKAALLSGIDGAKDDAKAAAIESVSEHFEAAATDTLASELQRAKRTRPSARCSSASLALGARRARPLRCGVRLDAR